MNLSIKQKTFAIIMIIGLGVFGFYNAKNLNKPTIGRKQGIRWVDTQAEKVSGLRTQEIINADAYSTHFKNKDDTVTAYFTEFAQNAQDKNGNWKPIDYSLKKIRDKVYDYETAFGLGVKVSEKGAISNDILEIQSTDVEIGGFDFSEEPFSPIEYKVTSSKIDETTLESKTKNFDLHINVTDQTIKQELILKNKEFIKDIDAEYIALKSILNTKDILMLNGSRMPSGIHQISKNDLIYIGNGDQGKIVTLPFPESWDKNDTNIETLRYINNIDFQNMEVYTIVEKADLLDSGIEFPITIDPDFAGDSADADVTGGSTTYSTARATSTASDAVDTKIQVGQVYDTGGSAEYRVYRGFVKFDTSSMGTAATTNQVNMDLVALNDYAEQDFDLQIHKYDWSASDPIASGTREAAFDGCLASTYDATWLDTTGIAVNTAYTSNNLSTAYPSKTGTTYYCLISQRDIDNSTPSTDTGLNGEYLNIASQDNATAGYRPVLAIDYSLPSYDSAYDKGEANRTTITTDATTDEINTSYKALTADEHTIGLWHMNEGFDNTCTGGEDICDSSSNGNEGTFVGTATFNGSGKIGNDSTTYDGNSDYTSLVSGAIPQDNLTLESWVYLTDISSDSAIFNWGVTTGCNPSSQMLRYDTLEGEFHFSTGCGTSITSSVSPQINTWYHVALTIDSTKKAIIYVDGIAQNSPTDTSSGQSVSTGNDKIGATHSGGSLTSYFHGQIDEVRLSNTARTPEEIKASASKYPYATYTSPILNTEGAVKSWKDFSWTEAGVLTGDGETVFDSTNLVAQWNFNETSGTTANNDAEGTSCGGTPANCDGTLSGFDSTASQDADPDSSWTADNRRWGAGALQFDGTDSYVYVSNDASLNNDVVTALTWVKTNGQVTSYEDIVMLGDWGASTDFSWGIRADSSSGQLRVFVTESGDFIGNSKQYLSVQEIDDDRWHLVGFTFDAGTLKVYIDGQEALVTKDSDDSFTAIHDTSGIFSIGAFDNDTIVNFFDGVIDTTQVYSRALSADEILSLYNTSNIQFETRVGGTPTPDATWEAWKPTTNSTQIESFDENSPVQNISQTSLVAHWKLDETSGTRSDSEGSNNLTDNNTVLYEQGHLNNSADFESDNSEYLSISDNADLSFADEAFTVTAWIKPTSLTADMGIIAKRQSGQLAEYSLNYDNSVDRFSMQVTDNSTDTNVAASGLGAPSTHIWYFVVGYHDPTANEIGISVNNGDFDTTAHSAGSYDGAGDLAIGREGGLADYFDGAVDEATVWNRLLTADEITQLYTDGVDTRTVLPSIQQTLNSTILQEGTYSEEIKTAYIGPDNASMLAYWNLDETNGENAGDDIFDSSSNNNDGEINGTSVTKGITNTARTFDGADDYIDFGDIAAMDAPTNLTISMWFKRDVDNSGTAVDTNHLINNVLIAQSSNAANDNLEIGTEGSNVEIYLDTAGTDSFSFDGGIVNDKWTHLALTYSSSAGTELNVYIDGEAAYSASTPSGALADSLTSPLSLGIARPAVDLWGDFEGSIDEVFIATGTYNAERIAEIYRMGRDHVINKTLSSTDLSDDKMVAFDIAADRPGTYLETIIGESAYANYQPDANTVGLWHFDEHTNDACNKGSNDVCDSSGNGYHGDETGSPPVVQGKRGLARDFDSTTDKISMGQQAGLQRSYNEAFTLETWVQIDAFTQTYEHLIKQHSGTTNYLSYGIEIQNATNEAVFNMCKHGVGCDEARVGITAGTWHHLAATFDGSTSMKIYLNGQLANTSTYSYGALTDPEADFVIGNDDSLSNYGINGRIDEARYSSVARTADEIRQAYEMGRRSHPITIDFAANLDADNLITDSGDLTFTVDATAYGLPEKGSMLFENDKVIIKENVDGTEYIAQGTVTDIQHSGGYTRVAEWDSGSTFPSSGYTTNATVFKWQREYFDLSDVSLGGHIDATTNLTFRVTNGHEGRTIYLDDLTSEGDIMTTSTGSTVDSKTGDRFYQYRAILSNADEFVSADFSALSVDYVTSEPDLYMKFDENYGTTAYDSSRNGNNGTITGATWIDSGSCISRSCLEFDGTDDNVTLSDIDKMDFDFSSGDTFTMEAWYKTTATATSTIFAKTNEIGTTTSGYTLYSLSSGETRFNISDGASTQITLTTTETFNDNRWHHAIVVADSSDITLYIDGIERQTKSNTLSAADTSNALDFIIGEESDNTNDFSGNIDSVKIYRYARTTSEIKADYNALASVKGATASFSKDDRSLTDGLVGYWKMDETSGNATDSSGNSNDLTDVNTVTFAAGKFANAGDFESVNSEYQYIADNASLSITSDLTLSAWINPESTTASTFFTIAGKWDGANKSYKLQQYGDEIFFGIDDSTQYVLTTSANLSTSTWYHVLGTYDARAQTAKIFINGEEQSISEVGTIPSSIGDDAGRFQVGTQDSSTTATQFYDGLIDEVRLYNKNLSPAEITKLYNWAPGPVGYWPLDENTGITTTYDKSGNGNDGTLNGNMSERNWVQGKFGSALEFDGTDDYVTIADNNDIDVTTELTMTAWIKRNVDSGTHERIISKDNDYGDWLYYMQVGAADTLTGGFNDAASTTADNHSAVGTTAIPLDTWTHIAFTYDGTTIKVFTNGVQNGSTDYTGTIPNSAQDLHLGRLQITSSYLYDFAGDIDEVKLYDYARTSSQIIQDMNGGHPIGGSPVGSKLHHYKLDHGSGTTTFDSGISKVNGTFGVNTPSWESNGKLNNALDCESTESDRVELGNIVSVESQLTVSAWIKPESLAAGNMGIVGEGSAFRLLIDNSGKLGFWLRGNPTDSAATLLEASASIVAGNWYHVAATWDSDADTWYLYVNGILQGDDGTANVVTSFDGVDGDNATICDGYNGLTDYFDGLVDDIKIYNTALTADEILIDMNAGSNAAMGGVLGAGEKSYLSIENTAPIRYWDMNENTGTSTIYDSSGNAKNGTLVSITESAWVQGKKGSALKFDGSADYVSLATTSSVSTTIGSLSLWFKTDFDFASRDAEGIIYYFADVTGGDGFGGQNEAHLSIRKENDVNLFIEGTPDTIVTTPTIVNDGNWHHIVATWDITGDAILYLDGKFANSVVHDGDSFAASGIHRIGYTGAINRYFKGSLDEVKVYDYALSPAQATYEYNRGKPIGHWKLDECTGTTAYDSSGNAYSGTISIGATGTNTSAGTCTSGTSTEAWNNGATGKFNGSLDFDGTDDYSYCTDATCGGTTNGLDFDATTDFSYGTWINAPSIGVNDMVPMAKKSSGAATQPGYMIRVSTAFESAQCLVADGTNQEATNLEDVVDGTWHHVFCTVNRTNDELKMYVDGTLKETVDISAVTGTLDNAFDFSIGAQGHGTTKLYWDGQIDDTKIYNYVLSENQVKNIYNGNAAQSFR